MRPRRTARRRIIAMLFVAVLALPTALSSGPTPIAPAGQPTVLLSERVPVPLDCADAVTLVINATLAPSSPQSRYAVVTLEGVAGTVRVGSRDLLDVSPDEATHIILRLSETDERVVVECTPGSVATLAYFDIPVVETLDLPARILGATFTRPGLRALDFENMLEVYAVAPTAGNLTVAIQADGATVPATLQAFGARPVPAAENWSAAADRVADDEDAASVLLDALLRLAVVCRPPPPSSPAQLPGWFNDENAEPLPCAGQELASLMSRYGVPAPAALELATRLASDSRCTGAAMIEWAVAPLDWTLGAPSPCGALVLEWLSDTADNEGLPATAPLVRAAATFAGMDPEMANRTVRDWIGLDDFFSGPCGGDPDDGPIAAVANRTHPERQRDCFELLAASLRPIRLSWQESDVIRRMTSLNYGASSVSLTSRAPGEGKITLSTQGPVLVDISIGLDPLPATVGDALGPAAPTVADLAERLDVSPPENSTLQDAQQWTIGPGLPGDAAEAATNAGEAQQNRTIGPVAEGLLLSLTAESCRLDAQDPAAQSPCRPRNTGQGPALAPVTDLVDVWRLPVPESLPAPADQAIPYSAADVDGALAAFLSPPGTMLSHAPTASPSPAGIPPQSGIVDELVENALGLSGEHAAKVFVPTRLQIRYGALETAATEDLPGAGPADQITAFVAERVDALRRATGLGALLPDEEAETPIELLLTGATFVVHTDDGVTHVKRTFPSHRLINLREGLTHVDFDLDGIINAQELEHAYRVAPGLPDDLVRSGVGLDPFNPDSDEDGMTDGYELVQCAGFQVVLAPCTRGLTPWLPDGDTDADADGLTNREEFARTHQAWIGTDCFAQLRWICHRDAAEAGLDGDCAAAAVLAWSQDEGFDAHSRDSDCDGAPDGWETIFDYDPLDPLVPVLHADADEDGLTNGEELAFYLDALRWLVGPGGFPLHSAAPLVRTEGAYGALLSPTELDSDGDGAPDSWEAARGLWPPLDEDGVPQDPHKLPRQLGAFHRDAHHDHDGDGLTTAEEFAWSLRRLAPELAHLDQSELLSHLQTTGLDPLADDSDGDGLNDLTELTGWEDDRPCLDPVLASIDCDGDGLEDHFERFLAGDPKQTAEANETARRFLPCTRPIDDMTDPTRFDWLSSDSDNDKMTDGYECWFGLDATNPADPLLDPDTDGFTSRFEHDATMALLDRHGNDASSLRPPPLDRDLYDLTTIRCPNFDEPAGRTGYDRALLPTDGFPFELRAGDSDCDGLPDAYEYALGLDPIDVHDVAGDLDRDGLTNWDEYRYASGNVSSVRALRHAIETNFTDFALVDLIRTFRLDASNADSDGDGMADGWEHALGLDPADATDAEDDLDEDGAHNVEEYRFSADRWARLIREDGTRILLQGNRSVRPDAPDTDGDGMVDGFELEMHESQGCLPGGTFASGPSGPSPWPSCFDPLDHRDAPADFDGDGLSNRREHDGWEVRAKELKATGPDLEARTVVTTYHTTSNPLSRDTSGGGLPDGEKSPQALRGCPDSSYGLDPWRIDTDADGVSDRVEVWEWTAVGALPLDIDDDCFQNAADTDSDGDSFALNETVLVDLSDGEELDLKLTDPTRTDTDDDLLSDGMEIWAWRSQGINPADPETDYNGDGRLPLRDHDADNDLIPDGYEFHYGLEAWVYRNETYGTDDDGLSDLCEFRITVGGDRTMCPEQAEPADGGPGATNSGDDHAPDDFGKSRCMGAADRDCDGDGIDDGFEYINQHVPGCSPHEWINHVRPDGGWTPCLASFIDILGGTERERYESIFGDNLDKPIIQAILLQPTISIGDSASCFYHRACRGTLDIDPEKIQVTVTITVQDRNCDLDRIRVQYGRRKHWDAGERNHDIDLSPADHASCRTGTAGVPETYTKDITIKGPWDKRYGLFKPRIEIEARDDEGHHTSVMRKITLSGRGLAWLDDANNAFEAQIAGSLQSLGAELLTTGGRALEQASQEAAGSLTNGIAYARHLADRGLSDYRAAIAWFDSPAYENAMHACGFPLDPPFAGNPSASCGAVSDHLRQAAGSRVKYLAGFSSLEDATRPITDALRIGADALYRSGLGQADVQALVGPTLLSAAGRPAPGHDTQNAWNAVSPNLVGPDDASDGCGRSEALVQTLRASGASQAAADGATLASWERAEELLRRAGYTSHRLWNHECTRSVLDRYGVNEDSALAQATAAGAMGTFLLLPTILDAGATPLKPGSALARAGGALGSIAFTVAWLVFDAWMHEAHPDLTETGWYKAACVSATVLPGAVLLFTPATAPIGVAVLVLSVVGVASCFSDGQSPPPDETREAWWEDEKLTSVTAFGNQWQYAVSTFPDVMAKTAEDPVIGFTPEHGTSDSRNRLLLGVRAANILPNYAPSTELTCGNTHLSFTGAVGLNVRLQRLEGSAWIDESSVRIFRDRTTGRTDQWSDGPLAWEASLANDDVRLGLYGPVEAGMRRIEMNLIPEVLIRMDGQTTQFPFNPHVFASGTSLDAIPPFHDEPTSAGPRAAPLTDSLLMPGSFEWAFFGGTPPNPMLDCSLPLTNVLTLHQGLGADLGLHGTVSSAGTIIDETPTIEGLIRTFRGSGLQAGPGYTYYWDMGGNSGTSIVQGDPDAAVTWAYDQDGTYEVIITVTDDRGVRIQEVRDRFTVHDAPTQSTWNPLRIGNQVSFSGSVTDVDDCLTFVLLVAGDVWEESPPCEPGKTSTDASFAVQKEVVGRITANSEATLNIYKDGRRIASHGPISVSPPPSDTISDGPVKSRFHSGYSQVDHFTYDIPTQAAPKTLSVHLAAPPKMRLQAEDEASTRADGQRLERYAPIPGTSWSFAVHSGGDAGCYALYTNLQEETSCDAPFNVFCVWLFCGHAHHRPSPPAEEIVARRDFEPERGRSGWTEAVAVRDRLGPAVWHLTSSKASSGSGSAYLGLLSGAPRYGPGAESDVLSLPIPGPADMGVAEPLRLHYDEWASVNGKDTGALRSVRVECVGFTFDDRYRSAVVAQKQLHGSTNRWKDHSLDFDCGALGGVEQWSLSIAFEWSSTESSESKVCKKVFFFWKSCETVHAQGWYVDNVRVVKP